MTNSKMISRAQGCLLGQLAGDALGSLVEFQTSQAILEKYPDGVRELADGGTFDTIAGQPTDDSEMALLLARKLVAKGAYKKEAALKEYKYWLASAPFDCGLTIAAGLRGNPNLESQANGAMMRVSPLGIFGVSFESNQVATWAMQDAALTHPNIICQQANALFAMAIAHSIKTAISPNQLYQKICYWAKDMQMESDLIDTIELASELAPTNYSKQKGWVLIAFQNALYQMLHAENLEEGVVDTVMRGGDTDTNAAICGALLGAIYGRDAIPAQWLTSIQNCRPKEGAKGVRQPRPECFWPTDALKLAEQLVSVNH